MRSLKVSDELTGRQLAEQNGVSPEAIRQQLAKLNEDGYVESIAKSKGRGRPELYWRLTRKGHGLFPDSHSAVFVQFLDSIRGTLGENALDTLLADRGEKTVASYLAEMDGLESLESRINRLAELRTAEGYMAEIQFENGAWFLTEHHCPICSAAKACQGFCSKELEIFERVLPECNVERVEHLLAGASRCIYRIVES